MSEEGLGGATGVSKTCGTELVSEPGVEGMLLAGVVPVVMVAVTAETVIALKEALRAGRGRGPLSLPSATNFESLDASKFGESRKYIALGLGRIELTLLDLVI